MAVIQRSGKVKTQGSSPIALSLANPIDPANSLVVIITSYSGGGSAQTFSGSCGGTALAVATNGNHTHNVGASAVLFLVDPPSGQTTVTVSSTNNEGYYTAALIEVPKISSTSPINRQSAITTATIAASGGQTTLTPNAGTTTAAKTLVVTGWGAAGTTATLLDSAAAPAGYDLEFSENDNNNWQGGAGASRFLTSTQAVAPVWTITASAGASQPSYLVGNTVVFELADQGGGTPPPDLSMGFSAIEPPDALALSCATLSALGRSTAEAVDAVAVQSAAALLAAYSASELPDTVSAALLVQASAVLDIALHEAADALGASAATLSTAQTLVLELPDATAAQSAAALGLTAGLPEAADTLAALLQSALSLSSAQTASPDSLSAQLVPVVQGTLYADLQEPPDLLALAATAQSLADAVLLDTDAIAAQASAASAAAAVLAETADATTADLATEAIAHMAVAVIEAPDSLTAAARGAVLAGAVLLDTDALQAAATALASGAFGHVESADALAALLAQQPEFATLDPRYVASLAARGFLAVRTARGFLAVRTARGFLAILRMGTTMTDTLEDKDPAEPVELTFSFDQALAPGVVLTSANVIAVQPVGGADAAAATWGAALAAVVGTLDAVTSDGTLPAGRYARVVVPGGAGVNGLRYLIAVQGLTSDPDVAPVCKALLPVVR